MTYAHRVTDERAPRAFLAFALAFTLLFSGAPIAQALGRMVSVVVVGSSAGDAAEAVERNGGEVTNLLPVVDGVSARVAESRIPALSRDAHVVADRPMRVTSASFGGNLTGVYPAEIGATRLWDGGVTGRGVTVALVDTGVADVPDLRGRIVAQGNFTRERSPWDTYGHGTFQAGLIAGDGSSSDGRYTGVAPEANLVSVKVADRTGSTSLGQVLAGVQLVDISAERFGIRAMLLAIDSQSPLPPELDPLSWALRKLWARGVLVVVPAGNDGPGEGTISSPGEDPVLLTVGSVDDMGTPAVDDDVVSDYSGVGPTRWGDAKPDVAAPGEHLVSLRAPGSTVDQENQGSVIETDYFRGSGTSMSSAVTVGAAALLYQKRPDLSPDEAKAYLMASANAIPDGVAATVGAGVIDVEAATDLPPIGDLPPLPEYDDDDVAEYAEPRLRWVRDESGIWQWRARNWVKRWWNEDEWDNAAEAIREWAEGRRDEALEARRWVARRWAERGFAARRWAARRWLERQFTDERWNARRWVARRWNDVKWESRRWRAEDWDSRRWRAEAWDSRRWRDEQWDSRRWRDDAWDSRRWRDDNWESRRWRSDSWESRRWRNDSWESRRWTSQGWT